MVIVSFRIGQPTLADKLNKARVAYDTKRRLFATQFMVGFSAGVRPMYTNVDGHAEGLGYMILRDAVELWARCRGAAARMAITTTPQRQGRWQGAR